MRALDIISLNQEPHVIKMGLKFTVLVAAGEIITPVDGCGWSQIHNPSVKDPWSSTHLIGPSHKTLTPRGHPDMHSSQGDRYKKIVSAGIMEVGQKTLKLLFLACLFYAKKNSNYPTL